MRRSWQIGILAFSLTLGLGVAESVASAATQTVDGALVELQVSPRLPTPEGPIQLSASITRAGCLIHFETLQKNGNQFVIPAEGFNLDPCPPAVGPVRGTFPLPPLAPGTYEAIVEFEGVQAAKTYFSVGDQGPALFLFGGGRFYATLNRADRGTVGSVPLTGQAGYYWFFDSSNVEATIKILDGRFVNGHFWIFVASMTDVPFTLTVTDLAAPACQQRNCPQRIYTSPAGKNTNFIDVAAF